jgi:hypothetical protein
MMTKPEAKERGPLRPPLSGPAACLRSAGVRGMCPGCDQWKLLTHCPVRIAGRYCSAECCPCCSHQAKGAAAA